MNRATRSLAAVFAACALTGGTLVLVALSSAPVAGAVASSVVDAAPVAGLARAARLEGATASEPVAPVSADVRVDQFGYLPRMPKVAVVVGDRGAAPFELRSAGRTVWQGTAVAWRGGSVDPQSGQRGAHVDFSTVTAAGTYELVDVERNVSSGSFRIGSDVYDDVLDAATRAFWFNRANVEHPADLAGPWAGAATVVGAGQDSQARWIDAREDASTARDLSGGWYDAGDTNKYVTFAMAPVHQLLDVYARLPEVFDDASGVPESGNAVADLLDEVRVELEWLEKMQDLDGGVLVKVGFVGYDGSNDIALDARPRFYEEACSSSTIAAAGMFAHGARSFATLDPVFSARLSDRAERAWDWYATNERRTDCDPQIVNAGDADRSLDAQDRDEVVAAVHLFALTGDAAYDRVVRSGVRRLGPFSDWSFGRYEPYEAIAVATYRDLPGADSDIVAAIDQQLRAIPLSIDSHGFDPDASLHRSFIPDAQYHWGSNMVMANTGNANLGLARLDLTPHHEADLVTRGAAHLHTLHGVNPLGLVYVSNMGELGAERSVTEIYHFWFADGTRFDSSTDSDVGPAPGYLTGGPNQNYSGSSTPPLGQAPATSYRDWNSSGDDRSWEITEPSISYQSAYIALLAAAIDRFG
ncbi:MAG: glycoside hydrolase family 9 protein [Ilumatobacter sp.]